jgi:hypothetical protein
MRAKTRGLAPHAALSCVCALGAVAWPAAGGSCPGDADGDGNVNVQDLVIIITNWNCVDPPGPCPGDVNGSGTTDVGDLVDVIVSWGPCPATCDSPMGAPANDCCADATVVNGLNQIGDSVTLAFDTTNAGTDGPEDPDNPCGSAGPDPQVWKDVWYRVTAPADGQLIASNCLQGSFDSKIAGYLGADCGSLLENVIECNEDCNEDDVNFTSRLVMDVAQGQTYTIRLGGFSADQTEGMAGNGPGSITFTMAGAVLPPVNDACSAPVPIGAVSTPFNTTGATTDGLAHASCNFPFGDDQTYHDIWFTYTTPQAGTLQVSTCNQADYDTRLVVYDNSPAAPCPPGSPLVLACNDDGAGCAGFSSYLSTGVTAGQDLLIRVGGFAPGEFGAGTLSVVVSGVPNDICEFATPLAPGNTVVVDLCDAEPDIGPDCGNGPPTMEAVWYQATGNGTTYTASLCGTNSAVFTRLTVYCTTAGVDDCDALFCDTANGMLEPIDDCGVNEEFSFCAVNGRRYLLLVHHDFQCGEVTVNLTSDAVACATNTCPPPTGGCCVAGPCLEAVTEADCASAGGVWSQGSECVDLPCPTNDACDDAIHLGSGAIVTVPWNNALASSGPDGAPFVNCDKFGDTPGVLSDLWFTWTAPGDGFTQFDTCGGGLDTKLVVYLDQGCPVVPFSDIACNDDDGNSAFELCGGGTHSAVLVNVSAGNTYRIRVGSWGTDNGGQGPVGPSVLHISFD